MKRIWNARLLVLFAVALGHAAPATAQDVLGRLESGIRRANGQPETAATTGQRAYLGAIALDDAGSGVRIASVQNGGPAQRAGLQAKDLIVGSAGKPVKSLADLTAILRDKSPGDRLFLDVARGENRFRVEVTLVGAPGMPLPAGKSSPPPTGQGAGRTDSIPPPPTDLNLPAPVEGPALTVPQPVAPNSPQAQIEELRHRIDQLERRVQQLEHDLAEARKK